MTTAGAHHCFLACLSFGKASCRYGWDDDDKMSELSDKSSRYLVVEDNAMAGRPLGFAQFGTASPPAVLIFVLRLNP